MELIPDIDFEKYLDLKAYSELKDPTAFRDRVHAIFNQDATAYGELLPWAKTYEKVQLRPGEVSIFAGINGHGKSMISGMITLWLLNHAKVCIASMEMKPEATLRRMIRQAAGTANPAERFQDKFLDWSKDRLWIYDRLDQVPTENILGLVSYCKNELGITHIVIDSLMKCGIDDDNYNGQKRFVDQLCQLAKQLGVHIHLIAHMRKGESENKRPTKFDVMGSSAITNLVDNLFVVHRNKAKEEKLRHDPENKDALWEPDCTVSVEKQRHGEWEGVFGLYFHPASQQYVPRPDKGALPFKMSDVEL